MYESFNNSGLLKKFIDMGKEYVFVSNIDNLGATVDLSILFIQKKRIGRAFFEVLELLQTDMR